MNKMGAKEKIAESSNSMKKKWKKYATLTNICFVLSFVFFVIAGLILSSAIRKGGEFALASYEDAKKKASEEVYQSFYDSAYESAEKKNHAANRVSIEVEAVREEAKLEVLKVGDVEYVIVDKKENEQKQEIWEEFVGMGVYTVDMKASEFITDTERQYVLVKVPKPELSNIRITETNTLLYQSGFSNKSDSDGIEIADTVRKAGYAKLTNYLKSNAQFYKSAKDSATLVITDLVKSLNQELPDLNVEVEFVD